MNRVEQTLRKADQAQQRHRTSAFCVGVVKKFGDDNGGVLAATMAHAAFASLFPLLLVLVTVLGLVAAGNPAFRHDAVNAVANQVPLIGHELGSNVNQLRRSSVIGLIVGLAALLWGATGLAQAGLFAMARVWDLPSPERPGYLPRLGRSAAFLALLGADVVVTTVVVGLFAYGSRPLSLTALGLAVATAVNAGMYAAGFRILTPRGVPARDLMPGAVTAGILWTVLQLAGTYLVHHFLHSDSMYGMFGAVLGLLAWLYLAVGVTVYCAEINVVLARRLWPRALIVPATVRSPRPAPPIPGPSAPPIPGPSAPGIPRPSAPGIPRPRAPGIPRPRRPAE
jgi:YihY family inner membrane protein